MRRFFTGGDPQLMNPSTVATPPQQPVRVSYLLGWVPGLDASAAALILGVIWRSLERHVKRSRERFTYITA